MGRRSLLRCFAAALAVLLGAALLSAAAPADARRAATGCVPRANQIHFRAADGTRLAGYRLGKGKTAIVLAHQLGGDGCQWTWYARRLASLGYLAIAVDFRGSGDSQTRSGRAANRRVADLAAAAKAARAGGATKVFVVGASMGGTVAVGAAGSIRPPVAGVVAISSPSTWVGVDALSIARRLQVPALYLTGENDAGFLDEVRTLYDATASSDKSLEILPGGEHGVLLLKTSARARALLEGFISRN
jgi:pimeloyl-ACP methyl ester carboxylesterase